MLGTVQDKRGLHACQGIKNPPLRRPRLQAALMTEEMSQPHDDLHSVEAAVSLCQNSYELSWCIHAGKGSRYFLWQQ